MQDFPFLYGITDASLLPQETFEAKTRSALAAGLKLIQYRDKSSDTQKRLQQAQLLQGLCTHYGARLIINDDIQLALEVGAAGVHLGQEDGSISDARALLGPDALLGSTCHNQIELAHTAIEQGTSYVAFGRFFSSKTKGDAAPAQTDILLAARQKLRVPVVAIGGITHNSAAELWNQGAHCLAVCNAIFATDNPAIEVEKFINIYRELS